MIKLHKKNIKKAILYGKISSNNANFLDITKTSQINSQKRTLKRIKYTTHPKPAVKKKKKKCLGFFYLANETSYTNSDHDTVPLKLPVSLFVLEPWLVLVNETKN